MTLLDSAVLGVCTGFSVALGQYFANKHLIRHIENVEVKLQEVLKSRKKD